MTGTSISHKSRSCIVLKTRPLSPNAKSPETSALQYLIYSTFRTAPERICADLKKSYNYFARLGNPDNPFNYSAAAVLDLMLSAGDFRVLQWLADQCGFVLYKLPEVISRDAVEKVQKDFIGMTTNCIKLAAQSIADVDCEDLMQNLLYLLTISCRFRAVLQKHQKNGPETKLKERKR